MDSTHNLQTFPPTAISGFTNPSPPPPPPLPTSPPPDNSNIAAAVIGTAASTFALYGFLLFAFYRFTKKKKIVAGGGGAAIGEWRRCDHCSSIVDKSRRFDNVPVTGSPETQRRRPILLPPPPPTPPPPPRKKIPVSVGPTIGSPRRNGPDGGPERPRLKRLHWEKVTPMRAGHSMVWDRINDGSIKFDDEQMEALFGYVPTNQNPPKPNSSEPPSSTSTITASGAAAPTQITLLDARKSQNIAIILRTLGASRHEILESLRSGRGLAADTLEKLSRIALTKDEESLIVSFSGDPTDLADADSFLFHLFQTSPSALPCIQAMHFRSCIYSPEILHLKQCLQVLQLACTELKTRGLFLKLLEAILKAGNRMNAGTARGDAEAFDLAALRKLSDVKSADGKTTLLHFVVGEVVRSEGKRLAAITAASPEALEHKDGNFMTLGLPAVAALSSEFRNVKKAAAFDCDAMDVSCSAMAERVRDIWKLLRGMEEMKKFVEMAEKEIMEAREEKRKVMENVRRTTEYYQLGDVMKEKEGNVLLQLFVIVRDFLGMVDQVCVDISRNVERRKKKKKKMALEGKEKEKCRDRFMSDILVCRSDSEEEL